VERALSRALTAVVGERPEDPVARLAILLESEHMAGAGQTGL
jgi:hypothetical protein